MVELILTWIVWILYSFGDTDNRTAIRTLLDTSWTPVQRPVSCHLKGFFYVEIIRCNVIYGSTIQKRLLNEVPPSVPHADPTHPSVALVYVFAAISGF